MGKKNGKGKLIDFLKNSEYEGEFKNDLKEGYGIEKYSDGSIYKGYFKNDLKEGKGKLIIKDTDKNIIEYKGEFKKDKLYGKGIINWPNKKQYYGELINNEISGYGILKEEKDKYIGYFKNNKKYGYGAIFYSDEPFSIVGFWENNNIEGFAIIFSLKERSEDEINENNDIKIINMIKGEIINMPIDDQELAKIKKNKKFIEMIELYKCKFYPEYKKSEIIL